MQRLKVYIQHLRVPKITNFKSGFRRFSTEEKHEESTTSEQSESKTLWGMGFIGIFVWFQLCIAGLGWVILSCGKHFSKEDQLWNQL